MLDDDDRFLRSPPAPAPAWWMATRLERDGRDDELGVSHGGSRVFFRLDSVRFSILSAEAKARSDGPRARANVGDDDTHRFPTKRFDGGTNL